MKRRAVLLTLSVLIAAIGTALIAVYVQNADNRATAGQQQELVLFAAQTIPEGTPASTLKSMLEPRQIPVKYTTSTMLTSYDQLTAGLGSTKLDIPGGMAISKSFFTNTANGVPEIPAANRKVLVPLSGAQRGAGLIGIGDNATVLLTRQGEKKPYPLTTDAKVISINGLTSNSPKAIAAPGADSTVGLSLPKDQAYALVMAQSNGESVYLISAPATPATAATPATPATSALAAG